MSTVTRGHRLTRVPIARAIMLSLTLGACHDRDVREPDDAQAVHVREVVAAGGVVDSILPIDEQLRRFRAGLGDRPDSLRGASHSIDALVRRWAAAVGQRDTLALVRMRLDRAEFAWLYYPGSELSKPPYESPPQLLWGQLQSSSESGARQLLARFGGSRFEFHGVSCPAPSDSTCTSRVYSNCLVTMRIGDGRTVDDRLFGSIIEHDGRFKFLGFANRL